MVSDILSDSLYLYLCLNQKLTRFHFVLLIALLHEDHRDKLVRMFDCLTRKEIDGRNSLDKDDGIWECVSKLYNNPTWVPRSHVFSELQFCQEMNLSLPNDAEDMSADKAKAIVKNLWGKYKKAVSGWRASGNGQEGKAREGEKIILHINGTTYKPTAEEHEDESTQIKYVDDDRLKFCVGDLSTAYLWGMVEEAGLSSFCMQNLGIFALENGRAESAKGGGRKASSSKRDSIAQTIGAIPRQVQQIMNSFDMTQQKLNDEKMILRCEDHLRQAKQLKYSCEDDYLRAKIEHNKMERCEDPDVGLYFEVMNMKKARVIDAEAMIAKWESRIRDLGEKDYDTSSLPDQGLDNSGTLDVLANLAITDMIFTNAANNSINDDDDDVGGEHDFGNELSIDQINDVVDNIHQEDD